MRRGGGSAPGKGMVLDVSGWFRQHSSRFWEKMMVLGISQH